MEPIRSLPRSFINQVEARDFPVLPHGNVATPGEIAPRHFLTVLSQGDSTFKIGSGRLELAERMFTDGASLAARVIVNRVWGWHFGRPLVATAERLRRAGREADASGIAGRSGGALHRAWLVAQMAESRNYALGGVPAVQPVASDAEQVDQVNSLLWRMNPRRWMWSRIAIRSCAPRER